MTDDQFERIKNGLNFHSEGGVYNLCTLTETALREIIEDAVKFYEKQQKIDAEQIRALQKQNGELTDELKTLRESIKDYGARCYENGLRNGRRKVEAQIEKMRNCANCKNYNGNEGFCVLGSGYGYNCNLDKWEIKEK